MSYFYESGAVQVTWAGIDLTEGIAEDTFLSITPNSDRVEVSVGADGVPTYSKIADKSCTIEITLKDVSPTNKKIAAIYAVQDRIGEKMDDLPFSVIDTTGNSVHMLIPGAVLTAVPEVSFQRVSGERTWTFHGNSMLLAENISEITARLKDYIKTSTNVTPTSA